MWHISLCLVQIFLGREKLSDKLNQAWLAVKGLWETSVTRGPGSALELPSRLGYALD